MTRLFTPDQMAEIKRQRILEDQEGFAKSGISTAVVNGFVVTIGDSDCDYDNYKHFVVSLIFDMGIDRYCSITDWDKRELIEDLANEDQDCDLWREDVMNYFEGMEGEF